MRNFFITHKGIFLICSAVGIFSIQNMTTKLMSGSFATHEILFIRAIVMIPIAVVIALMVSDIGSLRTKYPHIHMLRSLSLFVAFSGFFMGISSLPLPNAVSLFFAAPLFVTLLSALILRESIGVHRIMALCLGLAGVLIMVRPGFGDFNYASIFPLMGAFGYAFMPILTRAFSATESASAMIFYNAVFSFGFAGVIGLFLAGGAFTIGALGDPLYFLTRAWSMPVGAEWIFFAFIGITSSIGSYLAAQAYRTTKPSTITPFEYTSLLWATLWGFLVWGDTPDTLTVVGMVMVVASGLYIVARGSRLKRLEGKGKVVGNG